MRWQANEGLTYIHSILYFLYLFHLGHCSCGRRCGGGWGRGWGWGWRSGCDWGYVERRWTERGIRWIGCCCIAKSNEVEVEVEVEVDIEVDVEADADAEVDEPRPVLPCAITRSC